jgi:hypothetical protein
VYTIRAVFVALLCAAIPCVAQPGSAAQSSAHDGLWSVFLTCADTQDRAGFVRGYTYNFAVQIVEGRLEGHFNESTPPAFVHFAGRVLADGTLFIDADGLSGAPDATLGKQPRGTSYHYTMKGKLEADRGKAQRVEVRPCTAEFARQK